jgi:phosphoenolpyruvate carboxykinase (GTP)
MRVLKWVVDRVNGKADAVESPFGLMPRYKDITWAGIDFGKAKYHGITDINRDGALEEANALKDYFAKFGSALPPEMEEQRQSLADRASKAPQVWSSAA